MSSHIVLDFSLVLCCHKSINLKARMLLNELKQTKLVSECVLTPLIIVIVSEETRPLRVMLIKNNFFVITANIDENVKPPKRRIWETLFCCWRQRSVSISSRRSKSSQNGGSIDGLQTQTIGQATGLTGSGGQNRYLLPQIRHSDMHKKCMVIDLDETLVHSSFKVSSFGQLNKLPTINL